MKRNQSVAVLCFLSMVLLFSLTACSGAVPEFSDGTSTESVTVTMRIVTMEGEKFFDGKVKVLSATPTVYMALKAAAQDKDLELDIPDESTVEMMFLNGIADLKGDDPNYWMIYIGGAATMNGMGTQAIAEGDVVELLYGDYNAGYVEIK